MKSPAVFLSGVLSLVASSLAAEPGKAGLNATLPSPESNLSLLGDPLMRRIPKLTTVVRIGSGQGITLQVDEAGQAPLSQARGLRKAAAKAGPEQGLAVHPGLMGKEPALSAAGDAPVKASAQLDAVAKKSASVDGTRPKAPAAAPPAKRPDDLY